VVRILAVLGPKGGVGKSTLASNLLVAARLDGLEAMGLDLDSQRSFAGWAATRTAAGREPACVVAEGRVAGWRDVLPTAAEPALIVVDTPPGLEGEDHLEGLRDLALEADLVLVPALPKGPTLVKLRDVGAALAAAGARLVFVLNETSPRRAMTAEARTYLREGAELCEVEVPSREDVHRAMTAGLAVVEDPRLGAAAEMAALWRFAAGRL
jgi:chromosome partitioning protein